MRKIARSIIAPALALLAHFVVRRYKPKIVMVTGSVGKTSTKDALAAVLRAGFYVRAPEKSYNSEFGVPLTIFGAKNPWRNALGWLRVFKEAFALLLLPNHYPNMLVLEVGADRPGDLEKTLSIVTPDAVVVTLLPEVPVHVEAYASPEALREEEFLPARALSPAAPLIVCAHDAHALAMAKRVPAKLITYGEGDATVKVSDTDFWSEGGRVGGMQCRVSTSEGEGSLVVKGSVGYQQILPSAAALAAALAFHISLEKALEALQKYVPPPGRGRLFEGTNGSTLIDDSYNSSPVAVEEALKMLKHFPKVKGKRIAVLGDMLELGRYSVGEHERIGEVAREVSDVLITVGVRARAMSGAYAFDDSSEAAKMLVELVQPGDVVLIKGSQSIRTERIVEALLADPADLPRLVRQEKEWKIR